MVNIIYYTRIYANNKMAGILLYFLRRVLLSRYYTLVVALYIVEGVIFIKAHIAVLRRRRAIHKSIVNWG